jgi:hypothetical protein
MRDHAERSRTHDRCVIDHFLIVESLGESIEDMQESLLELPTREAGSVRIQESAFPVAKRSSQPRCARHSGDGLISERTKPFLRDCHDNTISIIDLRKVIDTIRM